MKCVQAPFFFFLHPHLTQIFVRGKSMMAEKLLSVLPCPMCNCFFIWKCQTTHFQLIPGKVTGKESGGNCFAPPCSQREAISPPRQVLLGKSWDYTRGLSPHPKPFLQSTGTQLCLWHCSCHLTAGMAEAGRGSQGQKTVFSCIPAQPFRARPWSQKFLTDKQESQQIKLFS